MRKYINKKTSAAARIYAICGKEKKSFKFILLICGSNLFYHTYIKKSITISIFAKKVPPVSNFRVAHDYILEKPKLFTNASMRFPALHIGHSCDG